MVRPVADHDVGPAMLRVVSRSQPRAFRILVLESVNDVAMAQREIVFRFYAHHGQNSVEVSRLRDDVVKLRPLRNGQARGDQRQGDPGCASHEKWRGACGWLS